MSKEKIIYNIDAIKIISLFQSLTKIAPKDYIESKNQAIFIVQPGEMGKAIGKEAENVKNLATRLKRKIKIVEFSDDVKVFIKNLIHPIIAKRIEDTEGTIMITPVDLKSKGYILGKGGMNLKRIEQIVKRYFDIKKIRVTNV